MRISPETIYQCIYIQGRGGLRAELAAALRTGRAVRQPNRRPGKRRPRVPKELLISERPAEADDRAVPGHWEGDLIIGTPGTGAIGTLVERTSRLRDAPAPAKRAHRGAGPGRHPGRPCPRPSRPGCAGP